MYQKYTRVLDPQLGKENFALKMPSMDEEKGEPVGIAQIKSKCAG